MAVGTHYPTWWFNQTAIHFLTFPEARSPRHQQYPSPPSEGSRGDSLLDSSGPTCPWLWLGAHSTPLSASIFTFPSPLGLCSPLLRAREDKQGLTHAIDPCQQFHTEHNATKAHSSKYLPVEKIEVLTKTSWKRLPE